MELKRNHKRLKAIVQDLDIEVENDYKSNPPLISEMIKKFKQRREYISKSLSAKITNGNTVLNATILPDNITTPIKNITKINTTFSACKASELFSFLENSYKSTKGIHKINYATPLNRSYDYVEKSLEKARAKLRVKETDIEMEDIMVTPRPLEGPPKPIPLPVKNILGKNKLSLCINQAETNFA